MAVKTAADLKGRKIGVSSARSLTGWLAVELSRQQGWGARGIELVGSPPRTSLASIKTGQIDGMVTDITFACETNAAVERAKAAAATKAAQEQEALERQRATEAARVVEAARAKAAQGARGAGAAEGGGGSQSRGHRAPEGSTGTRGLSSGSE